MLLGAPLASIDCMEQRPFLTVNSPIFVVGSPRSGTSILTWCLGQHSNILAQEESDWLGRFSLDIQAAYESGSRRGDRSQFGSLGVQRDDFFLCLGRAVNDLILSQRQELTRIAHEQALANPNSPHILPAFQTERAASDPKQRWVDGTPEYSFYIYGLRKLFPNALFIHLLRDVTSVVRSMLHFSPGGQNPLVENESQAYDYWLRTVRACARAERVYGPEIVYRVCYSDLIEQPETVFRSLLLFLREPYEPACLEPLQNRINSSNVPPEFDAGGTQADSQLVEEAGNLERELLSDSKPLVEGAAESELEKEFMKMVFHNQNVNSYYRKALVRISKLEKEIEALRDAHPTRRAPWINWMRGRKAGAVGVARD